MEASFSLLGYQNLRLLNGEGKTEVRGAFDVGSRATDKDTDCWLQQIPSYAVYGPKYKHLPSSP